MEPQSPNTLPEASLAKKSFFHRPINFIYGLFIITIVGGAANLYIQSHIPSDALLPEKTIPGAEIAGGAWKSGGNFLYAGTPIDPSCVDDIFQNSAEDSNSVVPPAADVVSLKTCAVAPQGGTISVNSIGDLEDDYAEGAAGRDTAHYGFAAYKVIASKGNQYVIASTVNGGGTGNFSSINIIENSGDTLKLVGQIPRGGDRCNGGLSGAAMGTPGQLVYGQAVTAFDIQLLGTGEDTSSETIYHKYESLAGSAASCYGTANYTYDLDSGKEAFVNVVNNGEGGEGGSKIQQCFDKLYSDTLAKNNNVLNKAALKTLSTLVQSQCLSQK